MNHIIGEICGSGKKQLILAIGAMHGNEPAGVEAIKNLFSELTIKKDKLNGKIVGLIGNPNAYSKNVRFQDQDLNRLWTQDNLSTVDGNSFEINALQSLHKTIEKYLNEGYERICLIDLHTTSAKSGVFIVCTSDDHQLELVKHLHIPVVLEFDKILQGTALQYYADKGHLSFAFEGGMHNNPRSQERMTSALWICLEKLGMINPKDFPLLDAHHQNLINYSKNLPHFSRVIFHHRIGINDNFIMKEGFQNFQAITKGDLLAHDKKGQITAPSNGYILMPLYQKQGKDGFFIIN